MPKIRIHADTSVFGGVCDEEFAEPTLRSLERARRGEFAILLSPHTVEELEPAPAHAKRALLDLPADSVEVVHSGQEVRALAEAYVEAGILGPASQLDALHVAAAAITGADLVLSWNFRHIVRYDRIRMFNAVNALKGYRQLDIRSPLEIGYEPEDQDV